MVQFHSLAALDPAPAAALMNFATLMTTNDYDDANTNANANDDDTPMIYEERLGNLSFLLLMLSQVRGGEMLRSRSARAYALRRLSSLRAARS
jgi:hypothetical protein